MVQTVQKKEGAVASGELIKFTISDEAGKVVISNVNNGDDDFSFVLMGLRRNPTDSDDDFVELKPTMVFDNNINYQVLVAGNYALRAQISSNVIVVVEQ